MTVYRIRLKDSGKVERVMGDSYIINPSGILTIYRSRKPIAEFSKRGWTWIKVGIDDR